MGVATAASRAIGLFGSMRSTVSKRRAAASWLPASISRLAWPRSSRTSASCEDSAGAAGSGRGGGGGDASCAGAGATPGPPGSARTSMPLNTRRTPATEPTRRWSRWRARARSSPPSPSRRRRRPSSPTLPRRPSRPSTEDGRRRAAEGEVGGVGGESLVARRLEHRRDGIGPRRSPRRNREDCRRFTASVGGDSRFRGVDSGAYPRARVLNAGVTLTF